MTVDLDAARIRHHDFDVVRNAGPIMAVVTRSPGAVLREVARMAVRSADDVPVLLQHIAELEKQVADFASATRAREADHAAERLREGAVRRVLADLVRLKDGPRDSLYRSQKDGAWALARTILGVEASPDAH